jgi:hypothetical protein
MKHGPLIWCDNQGTSGWKQCNREYGIWVSRRVKQVNNIILHNEMIYIGHLVFLMYICRRLRWAEHQAKRWEARNAYRIYCGNLLNNIHMKLDLKVLAAVNMKIKSLGYDPVYQTPQHHIPEDLIFIHMKAWEGNWRITFRMLDLKCS